METRLFNAVKASGGNERHGGDEVVARALIDWIFSDWRGTLYLTVDQDGKRRRCSIELGEISDEIIKIKITKK